jgi:hypothetical protein
MPYFAQIKSGKVVAVSELASYVAADDLIAIDSLDTTLLGATYADGAFTREVVPIVPYSVTMRQARMALNAAGKLSQVESAIDALPEPNRTDARIEWEYSNEVQRGNSFVSLLGAALSMSEAELDALFTQAATL